MLAQLVSLAGGFLTRRFDQEANPVLLRLLQKGPEKRSIIAPGELASAKLAPSVGPWLKTSKVVGVMYQRALCTCHAPAGQDDLTTPASIQRVRCAVLRCLRDIVGFTAPLNLAGVRGCGRDVLVPVAEQLLQAVGELLADSQVAAVREHATQAFVALAAVDPDVAWGLLVAALFTHGQLDVGTPPPAGGALPPVQRLSPPPLPSAAAAPDGLEACSLAKLQALKERVEQLRVPWHDTCVLDSWAHA